MDIFKGPCGGDIAYRVNGDLVYYDSCGGDIAFRISGDIIYRGSCGGDIASRKRAFTFRCHGRKYSSCSGQRPHSLLTGRHSALLR